MEPEEIDKIFKDRLAGLPVMPAADAWMRLQQKMEPPKKERSMWVYAAAASVVILLISGLLIFQLNNQQPGVTVAQIDLKSRIDSIYQKNTELQATPGTPAASTSTTETVALVEKEAVEAPKEAEAVLKPGAFRNKEEKRLARQEYKKPVKGPEKRKQINTPVAKEIENEGLAVKQNQTRTADIEKTSFAATSPEAVNVVQVLIKRDTNNERAETEPEETALRENISRKGVLLKNLYKQARNLKNGDPVELATLGLDTEKINTEKENIKQKLNNVISL